MSTPCNFADAMYSRSCPYRDAFLLRADKGTRPDLVSVNFFQLAVEELLRPLLVRLFGRLTELLTAQVVGAPPKRAALATIDSALASHFFLRGLSQYGLRHSGFAQRDGGGSGFLGYHLNPQRRQVSCLICFTIIMSLMVSINGYSCQPSFWAMSCGTGNQCARVARVVVNRTYRARGTSIIGRSLQRLHKRMESRPWRYFRPLQELGKNE